jgi:hypothetical protein
MSEGTTCFTGIASMSSIARLAQLAAAVILLAALTAPVAADSPPEAAPAPNASDLRVYVLDGFNPLGMARTGRLADHLRRAGFRNTRVGGWYSGAAFEREIRATHMADPTARFAVIGYSAGAYPARSLATRLVAEGVPVAVLGYIGGDYLQNTSENRVPGVGRVVNVTGDGYLLTGRNLMYNGTDLTGATNVRLSGTSHYGLPTHPSTFTALYSALSAAE